MAPNSTSNKILIVSAFLPEQSFLISYASNNNITHWNFLCVGIGSLAATAALSKYLSLNAKPQHLVFCGTAGAYTNQIPLQQSLFCQKVICTDAARLKNHAYFPRQTATFDTLICDNKIPLSNMVSCVCPPSITTEQNLATDLVALGEVENLELFAVAKVANTENITWSAILGIANYVGANAHIEWKQNHIKASAAAGQMLADLYEN